MSESKGQEKMKLEDCDVALEHQTGTLKLSELTIQDLAEIRGIAEHIIQAKLFQDEYQAIVAAFHIFADSWIDSNEWSNEGRSHH